MNKKNIFKNIVISIISFLALVIGTMSQSDANFFNARGGSTVYSLVFETNKNKLAAGPINTSGYSGSATATTELGNDVAFDYSMLINPTNMWQTIKVGGYIANTEPITGMNSISITKNSTSANFKVYWSSTPTFSEEYSATFDTTTPLTVYTNFAGYSPNYIKIAAIANSAIKDMTIEFACSNSYTTLSLFSNSTALGNVSGAGVYRIGQSVTVEATPNTGAQFSGWFEGETFISSEPIYTFNMPATDTTYSAKFIPNQYTIALTSEDLEKGSVTGSGTYDYLESVTITATPESGYEFKAWYDGDSLISNQSPYTFNMPYNSLSYVAKFNVLSYNLSVSSEDTSKGTVSGSGTYQYKVSRSITATPQSGYSFVGWYEDDELVSSDNPYTFTMPHTNLNYVAKFSINSYELTISSDTSKGEVEGAGIYAYKAEVTVLATALPGNEFIGWYEGESLKSSSASYTFTMPYNNLTLTARFVKQYNVDISSFDETTGTVSGGGNYGYTTSVTIIATPTTGHSFKAWYDDSFNVVSYEDSYTFTMPENDVTYYAEFWDYLIIEKGDTYTFGTYPQTRISDTTLETTLNDLAGTLPSASNSQDWTDYGYYISGAITSYMWYIDLEDSGSLYRGVYFTRYRPSYTTYSSSSSNSYQDENGYNLSTTYWFKFEPITWRVLDVTAGSAFLMANLALDSQDYFYSTSSRTIDGTTVYANNYEHSHIRSWLNDTFYTTAFNSDEQARIKTTNVDNSVASTGYSSNPYAGPNTNDKVFLLSYAEATNGNYGLNTSVARQLNSSDYAKSQGIYTASNGFNSWWLRSPNYIYDYYARYVHYDGNINSSNVNLTNYGVVPALWISR